jgi:hypothetical protein
MGTTSETILARGRVKEAAKEPTSLLHDFTVQQHSNVFMRAFSFGTNQLPATAEKESQLADRVLLVGDIGLIFQLRERENKVVAKSGDLEKWVSGQVVRKGVSRVQATRELLSSYASLSVVNQFGQRVTVTPAKADRLVGIVIYRVPPKSRPFRAARFKQYRNGGFVHILRDTDYFQISEHFVTPAELVEYFAFRREILLGWDPPSTAVSEAALIGQYLLEDFSSPPNSSLERAARSRVGNTASEFSFVLDNLASELSTHDEAEDDEEDDSPEDESGAHHAATSHRYEILTELALLGRYDLRALKLQIRTALEAVRANRFEQPLRIVSTRTQCGFLVVPLMREFLERSLEALDSLAIASKYELGLNRQVGIGMWQSSEFVDVEWVFLEGDNPPNAALDQRLARNYPFRRGSERRMPPIFT